MSSWLVSKYLPRSIALRDVAPSFTAYVIRYRTHVPPAVVIADKWGLVRQERHLLERAIGLTDRVFEFMMTLGGMRI